MFLTLSTARFADFVQRPVFKKLLKQNVSETGSVPVHG
jgi:hypothetical protein